MIPAKSLTKSFPVQHYAFTPVNDALKREEFNIVWFDKDEENRERYTRFNGDFKLFLSKLPGNNVKRMVDFAFNKSLIFIGISKSKTPAIFSRLLLSKAEKVAGIVIDSSDLEIDLNTGETPRIDDCIYAVYYSLIRAGVLSHKDEVQKDKDLHRNLVLYLNQIFLRSLGKGSVYNDKQKEVIKIVCIYIFHRHYLQQRHLAAISFLKRNYSKIVDEEVLNEVVPKLEATSKYSTIQDTGKLLVDLKIYTGSPNNIIMNLLRILATSGFYSLIGSLDLFIGFIVLARYPSGLFPRTAMISDKLHKNIEATMIKYLNRVEFDTRAISKLY